jgi:hypothetical protein
MGAALTLVTSSAGISARGGRIGGPETQRGVAAGGSSVTHTVDVLSANS